MDLLLFTSLLRKGPDVKHSAPFTRILCFALTP